ncbi:MAG: DUF4139 domain-containing protein [Spartobacteria bacterium]|nr:DUF4139 domain-containing protein [Spartobacteria bacterium]
MKEGCAMKTLRIIFLLSLLAPGLVRAKVDLVTLPKRDKVQLTIYNSADLTLVRDNRSLTMRNGINRLEFSWANTLIDPTSLEIMPKAQSDRLTVESLDYPPRTKNLGIWSIRSDVGDEVPMEITYLTSGLSWRAFYMGTLSPDEQKMRLQGYVRVNNNSGEDYENAQVRLIVGKVNIIDQIAELASRSYPYGRPQPPYRFEGRAAGGLYKAKNAFIAMDMEFAEAAPMMAPAPKEIAKEGLSEYFLYTIEGTETIPDKWSKRLPSFEADDIPVVNLYKYEEERYGNQVIHFLSYKNDKEHNLGDTPIPGGMLKVFRALTDKAQEDTPALSYAGESSFMYIPVGQDIELNLGAVENITVEAKLMDYKTDDYLFNHKGNITGWNETLTYQVEVKNTRGIPVKVEIKRNFDARRWEIDNQGDCGTYEKVDADTVKYTLEMPAASTRVFSYTIDIPRGQRED